MNQKILILGGSGLVGSRVVELLAADFEIISPSSADLDLTVAGNFSQYCEEQNISPTTIINFVAYANVDEAEKETGDEDGLCYQLNAKAVKELADYCKGSGNRLIHISTDYVFDGEKEDAAYTEDDIPNPLGWYGKTKLIGEQFVQESGCDYMILRISMPYRGLFAKKKDLARILLERLENQQPIQAIADSQITPLYIDEFGLVLKNILKQQNVVGLYHVAPTDSVTLEQFVRLIAKQAGVDDSLVTSVSFADYWQEKLANGSAKRPKNSWLDYSKLQAQLGMEFSSVEQDISLWLKQGNE